MVNKGFPEGFFGVGRLLLISLKVDGMKAGKGQVQQM